MEVVMKLPRPTDPAALERLVSAQQILCSRCVSEEDCERAVELLEELAKPVEEEGFGYFPALLTLASLHESGFEPSIMQDGAKAARYYLRLLTNEDAATGLGADLLDEAATQLCNLVKDKKAGLAEAELEQLRRVADGECAGAAGSVATWARYAASEASRLLEESRVDPQVREQREARRKAREEQHARELTRQQALAQEALARAEELRQQGNDDYRLGQLPGNGKARDDFARAVCCYLRAADGLADCLKELTVASQAATEVRKQRGLLFSNAAQVQVMLEKWAEVVDLAQRALQDDPQSLKSKYRLARAHAGLKDWEAAARTADGALKDAAADREAGEMQSELWKLAEEISKALPSWQWSSSKPAAKEKKAEDDFEKRIVGKWEYGPPGSMQFYEVVLEKWGALYWREKDMRVDLLRKGKLRWRGEYENLSGLVLNLSYEPGSDVLMTEFTPPPDVPEEQRWKGPSKFTAKRLPEPEKAPEPAVVTDLDPPPPPEAFPQAPPEPSAEVQEEVPQALPPDTPQELWLTGHTELSGCYGLLPDVVPPAGTVGSRAVYRRERRDDRAAAVLYLWHRGGNWGITEALNSSSLGAPFLARCPDNPDTSGRTRHPLEVRRPRWYVRRGRGQEEFDPGVALQAERAEAQRVPSAASSAEVPRPGLDAATPPTLAISGRTGAQAEVNGRYELSSSSTWAGRPVYTQVEPPLPFDQERPLVLFFDHGYWAVARGLSSLPRALARCHPRCEQSAHPGDVGGAPWEFLCDEDTRSMLVAVDTRKYMVDRGVRLEAFAADCSLVARTPEAALARGGLSPEAIGVLEAQAAAGLPLSQLEGMD